MHYATAILQLPLLRETPRMRIRTPAEVSALCDDIRNLAQETFHALFLDAKNNLANRVLITVGLSDSCLVHPREVFRSAITSTAAAVILVHNHPSGDPTPSAEDIRITKQLIDAGKIIGIPVLDHTIIGRGMEPGQQYCSLRESGLCSFA